MFNASTAPVAAFVLKRTGPNPEGSLVPKTIVGAVSELAVFKYAVGKLLALGTLEAAPQVRVPPAPPDENVTRDGSPPDRMERAPVLLILPNAPFRAPLSMACSATPVGIDEEAGVAPSTVGTAAVGTAPPTIEPTADAPAGEAAVAALPRAPRIVVAR